MMLAQRTPRTSGRFSGMGGLLLLNTLLLAVLAAVTFGADADAQARPRGNYLMVGGGVPGSQSGAVYIVDTVSQELIAINYDANERVLKGLGYRNLATDAGTLSRRRN